MNKINKFPSNVLVVGVAGPSGSGKDLIGDYAKELGFYKLHLAQRLKEACKIIFNQTDDEVYSEIGKAKENDYWGMTNRKILQLFGSDAMHPIFGPDIWCRALHITLDMLISRGVTKFVICDVRFPHEVIYFKEHFGGNFIYVQRPGITNLLTNEEQNHASETSLKDVVNQFGHSMWSIMNTGSKTQLRKATMDGLLHIIGSNEEVIQGELQAFEDFQNSQVPAAVSNS